MLTEPNINKDLIHSTIEQSYDIKIIKLSFVTGGEASWCYKVETDEAEEYFFKIHTSLIDHKDRFELTYKLFTECGIRNITHPIKNVEGKLVVYIDKYPSALFNFIPGYNGAEEALNNEARYSFGKLIGQIHKAKQTIGKFPLEEDFEYENINGLLKNMKAANGFIQDSSGFKKKTAELLIENKDKILTRIKELQSLGKKLRQQKIEFVICHGEPHKWNTMVNENGEVYLIDWDTSMFAPKEKDLNMIKDDPVKLDGYRSVVGEFEMNNEVISYYNREWNISEIDAWSEKLFHEKQNDIQNKHDLDLFIQVIEEMDYFV